MIEISNEELAKVLNLWTGTEEWCVNQDHLLWNDYYQRKPDGGLWVAFDADKEAHALVNFMLKERKYPSSDVDVFYPEEYTNSPEAYIEWVKAWEKRFGDKPQDNQPKPIDHSIPVRYDHLISTEELVKRAQERWPDDGWDEEGSIRCNGWRFGGKEVIANRSWGFEFTELRTKLLTIINEARSEKTTPEIIEELEECVKKLCATKGERFYTFLVTPQPDISPGLWGIVAMVETPVRGGCGGWPRKNVGALSNCPIAQSEYRTVSDMVEV